MISQIKQFPFFSCFVLYIFSAYLKTKSKSKFPYNQNQIELLIQSPAL